MKQRGFTLLEMLVATLIMGISVVGLMTAISTSQRNAGRVTSRERAAQLARAKMDELLLTAHFPLDSDVQGVFDPSLTGGVAGGWRARMQRFELPPNPGPGDYALDRMDLEIWWMAGDERRTFKLDGYRSDKLNAEEMP